MKAIAPPVTIPSMGTSTRDCRNSGELNRELKDVLGTMLVLFKKIAVMSFPLPFTITDLPV